MAKFSPNGGHFGYLDFSKYVFSNVFYYYVCRKDFWRNNYLFHCIIVENSHFCEILSYFGPIWAISRYPEFLNFCPMHYLPSNDFQSAAFRHKHCFSCVFQKFWFPNDEFWAKMGVFEGPIFIGTKNHPKNTWNMFIGSIRNPMQKSGDGPFFFFSDP